VIASEISMVQIFSSSIYNPILHGLYHQHITLNNLLELSYHYLQLHSSNFSSFSSNQFLSSPHSSSSFMNEHLLFDNKKSQIKQNNKNRKNNNFLSLKELLTASKCPTYEGKICNKPHGISKSGANCTCTCTGGWIGMSCQTPPELVNFDPLTATAEPNKGCTTKLSNYQKQC